MACFTCPGQATVTIIEQFGKFRRVANSGCNFINCCFGEYVAGKLSLRVRQLDVRCDTKTKDNVFVRVVASVMYQVQDGKQAQYDAFYRLSNTEQQITSYVFDVVRAIVPKIILDDVFTAKTEIAAEVKEALQKSMESFGFIIIETLVTDIEPDQKVRAAMNEINAAQRMRMAAKEKAEADRVMVVTRAQGDAEAKYLEGQGIARQRQAIVNGLRDSVMDFEKGVSDVQSRDVIEMMMITQYFDMLKDVGSKNATIFIPSNPGHVGDLSAEMRNGFLQGMAGRQEMKRE
ncbi:g9926 [Coccomyxa viridis]|uniref:G9926 protein n=1 Tax=Coccomyxa viridis TaxID=1274662 RepID=A0ABP1G409_9CHLO